MITWWNKRYLRTGAYTASLCIVSTLSHAGPPVPTISPDWSNVSGRVNTELSIEICVEPPLLSRSPIKDALFDSLRKLKVNYARLAFWFPYPRLSVAELQPPSDYRTYWDFTLLDSVVQSFYNASEGRPIMLNFSTVPQWMYITAAPVRVPKDPERIEWDYSQGTVLRDRTLKEVRDYYDRLANWYVNGGFVDERGRKHESGHHLKIDYWEVLNEIDSEHKIAVEDYTKIYDEVVEAVRRISPQTKFSGLALGLPFAPGAPHYFEYFLNPINHRPNVPLDVVSYHFYAYPEVDEPPDAQQFDFFRQADAFASIVSYADSIRRRLSPSTKTYLDEVGSMTANPLSLHETIPASYWHLSGAMFAYLYIKLLNLHIDTVAGAELIDYPGQGAGTTLSNWSSGLPNARFQVLKLLHDKITTGDALVGGTGSLLAPGPGESSNYAVQALVSTNGDRKLLLVNTRNRRLVLRLPGSKGGIMTYTDVTVGNRPPVEVEIRSERVALGAFSVATVVFKKPLAKRSHQTRPAC